MVLCMLALAMVCYLGGFLLQSINVALCMVAVILTQILVYNYSIYNYSLGQIYDLSFLVQLPST